MVKRSGYCHMWPSVVDTDFRPDMGNGVVDSARKRKRLRTASKRMPKRSLINTPTVGPNVQEGHQKPIASNPKKFGICGIRGMDGQSVSTKNWRRTARVFDDVGTRTTSTQDRWSYRHGC